MPGIEFLQNWELKKHGWPALGIAILWVLFETFAPKDPSCSNQVNYLQRQNTTLINELIFTKAEIQKKDTLIHQIDSAYHAAITPYKSVIINKSKHEND